MDDYYDFEYDGWEQDDFETLNQNEADDYRLDFEEEDEEDEEDA